jgi:hypothetical protein
LLALERRGTLPPARRASLKPMAIACFRSVIFLWDPPERNFPRFISCIARSTFSPAFFRTAGYSSAIATSSACWPSRSSLHSKSSKGWASAAGLFSTPLALPRSGRISAFAAVLQASSDSYTFNKVEGCDADLRAASGPCKVGMADAQPTYARV